jgi:hypothetical protein
MLDKPFEMDIQRIHEAIATAEVLTIFFPWLGRALIVDLRHDSRTPPAIYSDVMVGSIEERSRRIARLRPQFARPSRLVAAPWPAGAGSFIESGAFDTIVRRLYHLGFGHMEVNCRRALAELERAEQRMKLLYVRGEHCRTLYERRRDRR